MIVSNTWYVVIFGAFFFGLGFAVGQALFDGIIALMKARRPRSA